MKFLTVKVSQKTFIFVAVVTLALERKFLLSWSQVGVIKDTDRKA
jgi:hypothetical protein